MNKRAHTHSTLRRIICAGFALLLAISTPLSAIAADYTVATGDELYDSWTDANSNTDASNSFYITNDIEMDQALLANEGKTYNVSSAEGGDYELSNVHIKSPTSGGGTVIINTDVTATDNSALVVVGAATVGVMGDVTQTSTTTENGNYVAVEAAHNANVTINGNVTAAEAGVSANGANITVRGDITLTSEGDANNNHVIDADVGSNVLVIGDVTTEESGILAMRDSTVAVYGDLTQESTGEVDIYNSVISASEGSVKVTGTVVGEEGGVTAYKGTVEIGKDLVVDTGTDPELAPQPTAIMANNRSTVDVGGAVISSGNGIDANLSSTVNVQDGMIVESSALTVNSSTVTINGSVTSTDYSQITNGSNVKIYGDFALNPEDSETALGELIVENKSTLYMGNSTLLDADAAHAVNNSTLDAALVKADNVSVGVSANSDDASKFYAYTTTVNSGISTLVAGGESQTQIIGDIDTIYAMDNAYVEVFGSAENVTRTDKARVFTNLAYEDEMEVYIPQHDAEDYQVGNTTANTIIDLCQGYNTNSPLQKQASELHSLLSNVSGAISDELNVGSAAWTALFDHEQINLDSYMSSRYTEQEFYHNEHYNAESKKNFESAENLNTYLINMFKDNLAQSMVDLSSSNDEWNRAGGQETELTMKILAFTGKFEGASGAFLTEAEQKYLKDLAGSSGKLSGPDLVKFLRKFGYYAEDDSGVMLAAQRMSRAYDKIGPIMEDAAFLAKLGKAGMTVLDFAKYYLSDYTNQMIVLDEILANQTLTPEMYAAAAELRATMEDKMLGTAEKTVDLIKSESVDAIKGMWGPLAAGQAIIDIAGLITGGTKDAEDLQNGAALTILAPQLLTTFENAIENVKNGDTSEEAVQMVYMSYTMVQRAIANMCDVMTNIGDRQQETQYKAILAKLEAMDLGKHVELVE